MKLNQKAFGLVGIFIALVVLGVIAAAGWLVWQRSSSGKTGNTSFKQPSVIYCDTGSDEQKTWQRVFAFDKSFSMCVPGGWSLNSAPDDASFTVYPPFTITPNTLPTITMNELYGKDGTTDEVKVFTTKENYLGWVNADLAEKSTFTLNDGTKAERYYMKYGPSTGEGIGPQEGEEDYEYIIETTDGFVHAVYTILPGTDNHIAEVESVLKTIQFKK